MEVSQALRKSMLDQVPLAKYLFTGGAANASGYLGITIAAFTRARHARRKRWSMNIRLKRLKNG